MITNVINSIGDFMLRLSASLNLSHSETCLLLIGLFLLFGLVSYMKGLK